MAQLAVLIAGLLLIAEAQASDVADSSTFQGFLSKNMLSGSDVSKSSMNDYDKFIVPNLNRIENGNGQRGEIASASKGDIPVTVVDDKPAAFGMPKVADREEQQAVQKLLANIGVSGSSNPISLSAISIGLLSLGMILGFRLRKALEPAPVPVLAGFGPVTPTASAFGGNVMEMATQGYLDSIGRVGSGQQSSTPEPQQRTAMRATTETSPRVEVKATTTKDDSIFVDEAARLAESKFPLSPDEMIALSKTFLKSRGGLGADPALLADNFKFEGPVVGPLSKDEFVKALSTVDFDKAFPDFQGEFYGFYVDPFDTNRVWYTARGRGTNTGPLPPFAPEATGKKLVNPPQVCSLTFAPSGLVTRYTIGYVVDRNVGTTGGLGGLYGVLYAIGRPLPFPEAQPWKKSRRYKLFQAAGGLISRIFG